MAFKDIVVHIDHSKQCAARLALAVHLARECQAHLTGLYVVTHPVYAPRNEASLRRAAEAEKLFGMLTAAAQVSARWHEADWGTVGVSMADVLNHHAQSKDLIVIGQPDPEDLEDETPADLPERVIAGSGRPVLVVPYAGNFRAVGRRIVVAWRNGRESARAVNDAMPLLCAATLVSVVAIEPAAARPLAGKSPTTDICLNLERHGVALKQETLVTGKIPVGTMLLDYAWENGCDLMVMGLVRTGRGVGPVTRRILDQMTVPVLMAC